MKMVGFPSHFAIGLLLAIPWVAIDKKARYKTLIVGGFAGVAPDIDSPAMFIDLGVEHRGWIHSFELWFLITLGLVALIGLAAYDRRTDPKRVLEIVYDNALYLAAISTAWFAHLITDFGFTDFGDNKGWFVSLPLLQIWYLDNIMGFIVALILGIVIWIEIRDKNKHGIQGKFYRVIK